jgi:hypothetical protein
MTLFFEFIKYCGGADLQRAGRIPDATAVERHIDDLLFDLR